MAATVLVVDDNDDCREILALILSLEGYEVTQARNGAEALERARLRPPQAIVMDIFMPVMDGISATQALHAHPTLRAIPVIAQTAQASAVEAVRELFFAVLDKPCEANHLLALVGSATRRSDETATAS